MASRIFVISMTSVSGGAVMEYLEGETLAEKLHRHESLTLAFRLAAKRCMNSRDYPDFRRFFISASTASRGLARLEVKMFHLTPCLLGNRVNKDRACARGTNFHGVQGCQGLTTATPVAWKSFTFLVTTVIP